MLQRNLLEENSYFKQLYVWLPISREPHGEWGLCLLWLSAAVPSLDKVPSGCPLGASHRPPAQTHTPFTSSHGDLLWEMMHATKELLLLLRAWKGRQAVSPRIAKVLFSCTVFLGDTMTFKHRMAESETDPAPHSALADVSPRKVSYCKGFIHFLQCSLDTHFQGSKNGIIHCYRSLRWHQVMKPT